ncbi:MAG: hypothetical protein MR669_08280, partial [Selenomonadaceae bacterium]|nr:hypothetical protein [Selenomonadaceae bacterium]
NIYRQFNFIKNLLADEMHLRKNLDTTFCQGEQILSDTMNLSRRNLAGEDALRKSEADSCG